MQKRLLSPDEKERLAFRAEQLSLLCSAANLLDDIHEMMHETPEERAERCENNRQNLGDYINANKKLFINYLRQARNLPDEEELFFAELLRLEL